MEINKKLNIKDLKEYLTDKAVSGYIWYIHEKEPRLYNGKIDEFNKSLEAKHQIQEAYMYLKDKNQDISIRIINSDGKELCFMNKLKDFSENTKTKYKIDDKINIYPSHIKKADEKGFVFLQFKQVYQLTESLSDSDFKTWQPVLQFFIGLTTTKK